MVKYWFRGVDTLTFKIIGHLVSLKMVGGFPCRKRVY